MQLTNNIGLLFLLIFLCLSLIGCVTTTAPDGTTTRTLAPEAYLLARDYLKPTSTK